MNGYDLVDIQMFHRVAILVMSASLMGVVLELMRRGWLKEKYALVWLATATASVLVGIFPHVIVAAANAFHFQYLTVLFTVYFLFTLALVMSFTVVISQLAERSRELTQELALLAHTLDRLERRLESGD